MDDELELRPSAVGTHVVYRQRLLYSSRPQAGARARVRGLSILPGTLILWQSPLLWYGLDELERVTPDDCWIVGVEADETLYRLSLGQLPEPHQHRLSLINTSAEDVASVLSELESARYRRVVELTTNGGAMLNRPVYRRTRDLLDRQIQVVWQNRLTIHAMGRLWVRNSIMNLPSLLGAEGPMLDDRPVVVCGAGPSLDTAAPMIAEQRQHIQIIAVDTAVPALAARSIVPDLVIAVEAQLINAYDFLPVGRREYLLLADLGSTPAAVDLHARRGWLVSMHSRITLLDRLAKLPGVWAALPPLGSVGVSAVLVAMRMSHGPIYLTGLDFAVVPGQTHARDTPAARRQHISNMRLHPVGDPTLNISRVQTRSAAGNACATTLVLAGYAKELARTIGNRRVHHIAPIGPPVGAQPIDVATAGILIRQQTGNGEGKSGARGQGGPIIPDANDHQAGLSRFARNEKSLLERVIAGEENEELVSACDYLAAIGGIADQSATSARNQSVRILATYFRERWAIATDLINLRHS